MSPILRGAAFVSIHAAPRISGRNCSMTKRTASTTEAWGPLRPAHVAADKRKPFSRSALLQTDPVHGRTLLSLIHAPLLAKTNGASAGDPGFPLVCHR